MFIGGAKNVEFKQGHSVRFDLSSVLDQLQISNKETLVVGPGAADRTHLSINGELVVNLTMNEYNKVVTQRSFSAIVSEGGACQSAYEPKTCGPFQHVLITSIDRSQSTILFEIDVQERLTSEHDEENNFISVLRRSLQSYSDKPMALGGLFRVEQGIVNAHVMPDFLDEDLISKDQVEQWLKFYEMHAPLNCFSVLLTEDIDKAGFRLEHTHFSSEHGQAGHYHFDVSPKDIRYRGYFLLCNEAVLVDPVA